MEKIDQYLDRLDYLACRLGLTKTADWQMVAGSPVVRLYAGKLRRALPQYRTHVGVTPFFPSSRNIGHDVCDPIPLSDRSVDFYQSEDVFEHIAYEKLPAIFNEIHRVLKPGALFRLSVPDYGCDIYQTRSLKNGRGDIVFDPGGGGGYENGKVIDGGHLWFPTWDLVRALFEKTKFAVAGKVNLLHGTTASGEFILMPIDYSVGFVQRTPDNDDRVQSPRRPLSIVVDAYKMD